jgi:hypothetical protein
VTSAAGVYGTKDDGIYQLNADAGDLAWRVDFGRLNLGRENLKHLPEAYLGIASEDRVFLRVQGADGHPWRYPPRAWGEHLRIQRVDVGKGLVANWYRLGLLGECAFILASVSFDTAHGKRKIGQ